MQAARRGLVTNAVFARQFRAASSSIFSSRSSYVAPKVNAAQPSFIQERGMKKASFTADVQFPLDTFPRRHLGPSQIQLKDMLRRLKVTSLEDLTNKALPKTIRRSKPFKLPGDNTVKGEHEVIQDLRRIMDKNKIFRSFIGQGYYNCKVPGVIKRNVLENPEWYTPYTPYQAEISQGRLESLLNFQTMICDLTGMNFSNASLLDEATACAEAVYFCVKNNPAKLNSFFVSEDCFPQNIEVVKTRAEPLGIKIIVGDPFTHNFDAVPTAGALFQYPGLSGEIKDYRNLVKKLKSKNVMTVFSADLLALTMLMPPGDFGADVVVGSAQRFGVPLGYGGPHAGYFAVSDQKYARKIPGRVVGVSVDASGKKAYRLALQTREQHIKREKATSNICTAQALPANLSAFYAVYHGPVGLKKIAERVHLLTVLLATGLRKLGHNVKHSLFFDTVAVDHYDYESSEVLKKAVAHKMNFRAYDEEFVCISLDETTELQDVINIWHVFDSSISAKQPKKSNSWINDPTSLMPEISNLIQSHAELARQTSYLTNAVFNRYHKEHNMLRYLYRLCTRDLSLCTSMIPLGSCTMKLNATSEMEPITWPSAANIHPFVPLDQAAGYQEVIKDLQSMLCAVTGFDEVSLQPNSGASGEYTGLRVITKYLESKGQGHRDVVLIPASSHGTNPASAMLAGLKIVVIPCHSNGYINMDALKTKAKEYGDRLAALMITYPSTYGIYEETIKEVCETIHQNGGQVYLDGANMNALVGLVSLKELGADVCHLNLHKTFCIPHGGGGPGMGPIGVSSHLAPFLPSHPVVSSNTRAEAMGPVSAAPWSSGSILLISWMYLRMMGSDGLRKATQTAILNANYMKERLKDYYPVKYTSPNGYVAHEFIMDLRPFKKSANIEVEDVAKRLMDYNFHSPTMSWPVPGTLMLEPTESESMDELDRLCNALISIRQEIMQIEDGTQPKEDNVLKNAPHVPEVVCATEWTKPYPRELAAYPLPYLHDHKFWPSVSRIDNVFGDTHLICSCPPLDTYL